MNIRTTITRFTAFAGLSAGWLVLSGCASFVASEEWRCVDDKGAPLEGVIALYAYSGTSWGPSYSKSGGYAVSDERGVIHYPLAAVGRKPLIDSVASRYVGFLYSAQTHVAYRNGGVNGALGLRLKIDSSKKLYTFIDVSKNPAQWYVALRELLVASEGALDSSGDPENYYRAMVKALPAAASAEREMFLRQYGASHPPTSLMDAIEYAKKYHVSISGVTFSMLLEEPTHES